jgi:putative cell wall-binding protein
MFGFGKKKKEEPKRPPPDLNNVSLNLSNKMNDMALKIQQTDKELRAQLTIMRTSGNPTAKAQAKKKATQLLKKKKMYENHYNNLSGTQMTVDSANVECQMMKDNFDIVCEMTDNDYVDLKDILFK